MTHDGVSATLLGPCADRLVWTPAPGGMIGCRLEGQTLTDENSANSHGKCNMEMGAGAYFVVQIDRKEYTSEIES